MAHETLGRTLLVYSGPRRLLQDFLRTLPEVLEREGPQRSAGEAARIVVLVDQMVGFGAIARRDANHGLQVTTGLKGSVLRVCCDLKRGSQGKRGCFKRGGFPIWTCPSFLSFFVLFGTFPIFLGFSRFARGWSGDFPDLSFSAFSAF